MTGCGKRVLAAIVCIRQRDAFTLQATIHRLASTRIGEAVKWARQQYDCQQTDNDLDAAPHFYLPAYHQLGRAGSALRLNFMAKSVPDIA